MARTRRTSEFTGFDGKTKISIEKITVVKKIIFSKTFGLIVFLGIIFIMESCRKDPVFNTDPNFQLEFSNDTIRFDTIFSTIGSTTFWLKVYNRSNKDINIQSIELDKGETSPFRMNVNGDTSLLQTNVRLRAKDSLFIFIRVTINLEEKDILEKIVDYIRFSINNRSQNVVLQAFGQNAIFHLPKVGDTLEILHDTVILRLPYSVADPSVFANSQKPHVIYGYLLVQEELILNAGTRLHFAPNSGLIVAEGGSLKIFGSLESRVIFEGLRTDTNNRNTTAQWDRIWFLSGSIVNSIEWAIIRNGKIGLLIDSMPNFNRNIEIHNTIIHNMQQHGISARHAAIRGSNLQVSNCGERLLSLTGGEYVFDFCTFANYFSSPPSTRRDTSVFLDETPLNPLIRAEFSSCIIYGTFQEELKIRLSSTENIKFEYCNIRTRINQNDRMFHRDNVFNTNPIFKNTNRRNGDFDFDIAPQPIETSGVIRKGGHPNIPWDLKERPRTYSSARPRPTIGAYEFNEVIE
jgi:hypothetical protein